MQANAKGVDKTRGGKFIIWQTEAPQMKTDV